MTRKEVTKLVKRFGGWMEGDTSRFPSPYQKDQFCKAMAANQDA